MFGGRRSVNAWPILAAVVLAIGAGAGGYVKGRGDGKAVEVARLAVATAKMRDDMIEAAVRSARTAEALRAQRVLNEATLRDYENAVGTDTGAASCGPSPDGLLRFKDLTRRARAATGQ